MDKDSARLEAILFSQVDFVSLRTLMQVTGMAEADAIDNLNKLKQSLKGSGLALIEHNKTYQLVASSKYADDINAMRKEKAPTLSQSSLEVLAIVAYHQPVSKSQIEQIRGVSSDQSIKSLLARKLLHEVQNTAKTQISYKTTGNFLRQIGLTTINDLPKPQ